MKTLRDPAKRLPILARWTEGPQSDTDPRDFFRVLWRRKWMILLCLVLIPLAAYVYSDRLTKSFQSSTIVQVQSTATDAGLFSGQDLPTGSANTAKIAALVGTSGVADEAARLMGEPEGSLRGADTRHGRRGDRLHHDHGHGRQRRARRGDRQYRRQGAQGHAQEGGDQACRRLDRERREGAREASAGGGASALAALGAASGPSRAPSGAGARTPRWWSPRGVPASRGLAEPEAQRDPRVRGRPAHRRRSRGAGRAPRPASARLARRRATHGNATAGADSFERLPGGGAGSSAADRVPDAEGQPHVLQRGPAARKPARDQPAEGRRQDERVHQPGGGVRALRQAGDPGGRGPAQPSGRVTDGHAAHARV